MKQSENKKSLSEKIPWLTSYLSLIHICIFMFGLFYIVVTNFSSMVKTAEEGVAVTGFFNEGTTEDVIKADKAQIEKRARCV